MSLDHLTPEARVLLAGIAPLRAPETGAEALLLTSRPEDARRVLARALAKLGRLHDRLLDLQAHLIEQLDRIDGDPDLEQSLGASEGRYGTCWASVLHRGSLDECETGLDLEPWLGSMSNRWDQRLWSLQGENSDGEQAHDGREPGGDDEGDRSDFEPEETDTDETTRGCVSLGDGNGGFFWPPAGTIGRVGEP
jgi:hypothetical protein